MLVKVAEGEAVERVRDEAVGVEKLAKGVDLLRVDQFASNRGGQPKPNAHGLVGRNMSLDGERVLFEVRQRLLVGRARVHIGAVAEHRRMVGHVTHDSRV